MLVGARELARLTRAPEERDINRNVLARAATREKEISEMKIQNLKDFDKLEDRIQKMEWESQAPKKKR